MKSYKPQGGYKELPCYIESTDVTQVCAGEFVAFAKHLAPAYATYRKAVISVPEELDPEVSSDGYLVAYMMDDPAIRVRYYERKALIPCRVEWTAKKEKIVHSKPYMWIVCPVRPVDEDE